MSELPGAVRWAIFAWAAFAGAAVGSFLNVVVARVPAGESVVHPRSRCPRCGSSIAWYDNVPVLSWVLLRARCRGCGLPISWRYPVVELLGAGAALLAVHRHGLAPGALTEFAFVALLVALAFIDLDTWLLPHTLTWPTIGLGLVASALGWSAAGSLRSSLWGAAIGFVAFAALSVGAEKLLRKEALGFGDVWLLAGLGAFLGRGALLPVVLLASLQGAAVGLLLIAIGRAQPGPQPEERTETSTATETATGTETATATPTETASETATETATETPGATATPSPLPENLDDVDDWIPPKNAVPFGPFLVAAALEWLWAGDVLARAFPALRLFR